MTAAIVPIITGLAFAEAPRWRIDPSLPGGGELWFSDFFARRVMRIDGEGRAHTVVEVPNQPSGLGWLPDGRLLVVSMLDRKLMRLDAAGLVEAADLSALASFPCNDMVVDASGRAYIGNFGFDIFARPVVPKPTVLAMVTPDGAVSIAANEVLFPNGAVITPDGRTMILAETFGRRLTAYDIASDGTLANRRLWADLDNIAPDGICLDAEGAVWVASPRSNEFVRVLQGGRLAQRIASPQQGIACALGGADGRTLFLVSGRVRSRADSLADRGGRIDAIRVEVPAAAPPGII